MKSIITIFTTLFIAVQITFAQLPIPGEITEVTSMEFEEMEATWGTIDEGDQVSHVYKFTNTGDLPLLIISAKGSCGCTIPFFPKDPILPGETSEIEVEFNSKNKKGKRNQKISIIANTEPTTTFLYFKGEVTPKVAASEETKVAQENRAQEKKELESLDPSCIALFPNPANEFVQLELKDHIGKSATVTIFNQMGQEINSQKIERISRESTRIGVNNFAPGAYVISIAVDNLKPMTQCFMVARP